MKRPILCFAIALALVITNECNAEKINISEREKVQLANKWLKEEYLIREIPVDKFRQLLLVNNFNEIEKLLSDTENEFKSDIKYEFKLLNAYEAFTTIGQDSDTNTINIDKWASLKKSYIAYAAKGFYLSGRANKRRGNKYVSQTSENNMSMARSLWTESIINFKKSLEINGSFLPSNAGIMAVGMVSGDREAASNAIHVALASTPEAFYIRSNYLEYLQPKWGGTYDDANKFIEDAQKYGEKNPRIWTLRGFIPNMLAYQYQLDGKFALAISKYSEALKYGDRPAWIRNKAFCQYMLADYQGAIESMMKVASYIDGDQNSSILRVVNILQNEEKNKHEKGHLRPADTLNSNGEFNGPLDWKDFQ